MFGSWKGSRVACCAVLGWALAAGAAAEPSTKRFSSVRPSTEAQRLVTWILASGDPAGKPFAVVDKRAAKLYVFDARGGLAGHTAALLGSAWGDHSVPGVGLRTQTNTLTLEDRTTPAGRFESVPGRNNTGEHVVWADYETAFAIHRLRPGPAEQPRARRLATMTPDDNRVSYGCVVVPVAFYERVVLPVLGASRAVVYVMPETQPLDLTFGALAQ
jgi:hypothetical protein